jgi:hypothetical protein
VHADSDFDQRAVAAITMDSAKHLVFAWRRGASWRATTWRGAWYVGEVGTTAVDSTHTLVMIMGASGSSGAAIYSVRGELGDSVVWSAPAIIATIGPSFTSFAWGRLGRDSVLVTWHQEATESTPSHIATALSTDAGQHWLLMPPLRTGNNVDWLEMAIDRLGTAHLVYRTFEPRPMEPGQIMRTTWHKGLWYPSVALSKRSSWIGPMIGRGAHSSLTAIWSELYSTPSSPPEFTAKSFASVWSATCR